MLIRRLEAGWPSKAVVDRREAMKIRVFHGTMTFVAHGDRGLGQVNKTEISMPEGGHPKTRGVGFAKQHAAQELVPLRFERSILTD